MDEIPSEIYNVLIQEVKNITYGKISLGINVRDGHVQYYELDKHVTFNNDKKNDKSEKDNIATFT